MMILNRDLPACLPPHTVPVTPKSTQPAIHGRQYRSQLFSSSVLTVNGVACCEGYFFFLSELKPSFCQSA
jgi:hypothetical protein